MLYADVNGTSVEADAALAAANDVAPDDVASE